MCSHRLLQSTTTHSTGTAHFQTQKDKPCTAKLGEGHNAIVASKGNFFPCGIQKSSHCSPVSTCRWKEGHSRLQQSHCSLNCVCKLGTSNFPEVADAEVFVSYLIEKVREKGTGKQAWWGFSGKTQTHNVKQVSEVFH